LAKKALCELPFFSPKNIFEILAKESENLTVSDFEKFMNKMGIKNTR